ncbi:iron-sulfur cluster assembly protein [Rubritalea squalenifaciens DSM 18772]|uniref:Iron-sulfur cluster assembly protein n=1 Tax=Rubritalea squalenifaciens DSM 18772 TaxID=1123071 RepID=A0A1M6J6U1_9BACT|nr:iron-sulfur cluster assembly accessory protein [Rubritalea squalenifaciens]SHJ42375.1 iron-sulfur cluster assembly protein [Rubritalea squalenifaciens DSM 18772]
MITLSTAAVKELKSLLETKNAPAGTGLRLGVQKGGCAGLSYTMQVSEAEEGDITLEQEGVVVHISPDSVEYLKGCVINYEYSLSDSGFKIVNPNASRSCGCGTSFEAKGEEGTYDPANECK